MSAVLLVASLALGQTYDLDYEQALKDRTDMVVGVGCVPPPGPYKTTLVSKLAGYKGPCIVLARPYKEQVVKLAVLPATATSATIQAKLAERPWWDAPRKPAPAAAPKYNPETQELFQPKMDRRRRVYYETPLIAPRYRVSSTPAFRAGSC